MATINLAIVVPDDQVSRMRDGLRAFWGQIEDPPGSGQFRDMTNAEVIERLRKETIGNVKRMVLKAETLAAEKALQNIAEVDAT
jgi:hypothetical protein